MYVFGVVSGFIQMLLLGYIFFKEVTKKSPALFLWATLMIMFGVPHFITSVFKDTVYSDDVILDASIFAIAFSLLYIFFRSSKRFLFIQKDDKNHTLSINTAVAGTTFENLCFIIFLVSIVGYMWSFVNNSGGILDTSWSGGGIARGVVREYVGFTGLASRLVFTFSGLSLYFYLTKRKFRTAIVLLLFAALVVLTRNRVQILPIFIFFISLYIINIKKVKGKHFLFGLFAACAVIYIVYAFRAFRWLGTLSNAMENFSWSYINEMVFRFINEGDGELGLRRVFYYFIYSDNNFEGFNKGVTLFRMLLVFIPSQWSFGLKPQSFDLYMGQATGMVTGGSTHPTLFGDCFGNLYWFGILLGVLWAFIANFLDYMITKQKDDFFKIMIFFLASYSFVVVGRGSVSNGFDPTAWGILFLIIIKFFFLRLKNFNISIGRRKNDKLLHTK